MKQTLRYLLDGFTYVIGGVLSLVILVLVYLIGIFHGYNIGKSKAEIDFIEYLNAKIIEGNSIIRNTVLPTPTLVTTRESATKEVTWGGPELWEAVNKRRVELGVNPLGQRDELCTIASIRLNELLKLGELDGHEGFGNLEERRSDLKWIFDEYGVIAEFLAVGGDSAFETVSLWENTLAHKKIVSGGEFVWGCIYAQDSFAVGIAAY